ncbi:MAG: hypothetical protein RL376_1140 [Verrucomicrobiota bacterium]|jgi:signal transduction histidine kinase/CheY-like chemotaxis protein
MTGHPILLRQLRRIYGSLEAVPPGLEPICAAVSASYQQFDKDRQLTEHAMAVSSTELSELNASLREQNERNELLVSRLRKTISLLHPTAELETSDSDLMRLADMIDSLVAKRQETEDALRAAKTAADAASQAKSDFLANMSHEIRTPLNGILGTLNLLNFSLVDEQQRRYTELALKSGGALLSLINDILDFSKIEAGKLSIETVNFDLGRLLQDLRADLAQRAEAKQLVFTCAPNPGVPVALQGDPGRIRQVLLNLAGNAVKFTPQGRVDVGVSLVALTANTAKLRFTVRDTGIGIPEERRAILFNKFTQVDASTTRKFGGTGLGLAISKQLVEIMGGDIAVVSREGAGSEFSFTLTLARQAEAPEPTGPGKVAPPRIFSLPAEQVGARVLVAEDNLTNQDIIQALLGKLELLVEIANNGEEAVKAVAERRFDLVFMDVQMPQMGGYEATRLIRESGFKALPIIAMTANAMTGDREKCLEAGMDDYISKPFEPKDLVNVLKRWLPARRPS